MSKEVTIVGKADGYVSIGILEDLGRKYLHIRLIDGSLVGGTEPSGQVSKVLRQDVEIIDGYRYDLLIEYVERTKAVLRWQTERQEAVNCIKATATAKVEKQVRLAIRRWEREHPRPDAITPRPEPPEPEPVPAGDPPPTNSTTPFLDNIANLGKPEPLSEEQQTSTPGGNEFMDDEEKADDERAPTESGSSGPWSVGDTVSIKATWDTGIVSKAQPEDGEYWVSVEKGYPQKFMANELEAPDPAQREA